MRSETECAGRRWRACPATTSPVLAALYDVPGAVGDLEPEERAMVEFMREVGRFRAGLPHALTDEQLGAAIEAREDADALARDLAAAGPAADVNRVVDEWAEEHGFHR